MITGVVEKVLGPSGRGTYDVQVGGVKYGTYTNVPKCAPGDVVEFEAKQNGNFWNMNVKSLRVTGRAAAQENVGSNTKTKAWVPDDKRQDAISYQAARKDALQLMDMLLSKDVVDFGKAKNNSAKIDVVEVFVDKYTQRYFEDTKNLGHKLQEEPASEPAEFNDDIPFG